MPYFRRGYGAPPEDVDGKTYIDYTRGDGTMILGYFYPQVVERVQEALQQTHRG